MKDYWNDPPEHPELPEWAEELEALLDNQDVPQSISKAIKCAIDDYFSEGLPDDDALAEMHAQEHYENESDRMVNFPKLCPHGREWFDCGACDHAADIAFDSAREGRMK